MGAERLADAAARPPPAPWHRRRAGLIEFRRRVVVLTSKSAPAAPERAVWLTELRQSRNLAGSSIGRTPDFGSGGWRFEPSPASSSCLIRWGNRRRQDTERMFGVGHHLRDAVLASQPDELGALVGGQSLAVAVADVGLVEPVAQAALGLLSVTNDRLRVGVRESGSDPVYGTFSAARDPHQRCRLVAPHRVWPASQLRNVDAREWCAPKVAAERLGHFDPSLFMNL